MVWLRSIRSVHYINLRVAFPHRLFRFFFEQEVCAAGSEGTPSEVRIVIQKVSRFKNSHSISCFMIKTESRMKVYLGLVEGIKQHSKLILNLKNLWSMVIFRTILVTGTEV